MIPGEPMPVKGLLSYVDEAVQSLNEIPPTFQSVGDMNQRINRCRDVDGVLATKRWKIRDDLIHEGMEHSSKVRTALTLVKQHLQHLQAQQ